LYEVLYGKAKVKLQFNHHLALFKRLNNAVNTVALSTGFSMLGPLDEFRTTQNCRYKKETRWYIDEPHKLILENQVTNVSLHGVSEKQQGNK